VKAATYGETSGGPAYHRIHYRREFAAVLAAFGNASAQRCAAAISRDSGKLVNARLALPMRRPANHQSPAKRAASGRMDRGSDPPQWNGRSRSAPWRSVQQEERESGQEHGTPEGCPAPCGRERRAVPANNASTCSAEADLPSHLRSAAQRGQSDRVPSTAAPVARRSAFWAA
jgi:hypothetical protein